jgi:hypothetical protein
MALKLKLDEIESQTDHIGQRQIEASASDKVLTKSWKEP